MNGPVLAGTIWLGVFALLVVAEMISVGLTSIWFAISALISSIMAFFGADIYAQLVSFIIFSVVFLVVLRPYTKKRINTHTELTNAEGYVGKTFLTVTEIDNDKNMGQIRIGDVEWHAVSEDGSKISCDTKVVVTAIEGTKLIVKRA